MKNTKLRKILTLMIAPIIILSSCSKEDELSKLKNDTFVNERSSLPTIATILDLLREPVDGYFYLTSESTYSGQNSGSRNIGLKGFVNDHNGYADHGTLSIGSNINLNPDQNSFYGATQTFSIPSSLFGQSNNFSLSGTTTHPGFTTNFYVPELITITNPGYQNTMEINSGMELNWDADNNNSNGIGIVLKFSPSSLKNELNGGFTTYSSVVNEIYTEDDGSYIFSAQDFAGIPSGANIELFIGRGNYAKVPMTGNNSSNKHVGLVTYSIVKQNFDYTN